VPGESRRMGFYPRENARGSSRTTSRCRCGSAPKRPLPVH
jgi:hypothetical protein